MTTQAIPSTTWATTLTQSKASSGCLEGLKQDSFWLLKFATFLLAVNFTCSILRVGVGLGILKKS